MYNNKSMYEIYEKHKYVSLEKRNPCVFIITLIITFISAQCTHEQVQCYAAAHNAEYTATIAISGAD